MPLPLSDPPTPNDWARHTPTSDPGQFAPLLDAVPPVPAEIGAVDRNLIAHYRAQEADLPAETRGDIHLRWLQDQLATDQRRHPHALAVERPLAKRLQGCCRDHTLFGVAVLRQHGVPARSRVGFAGYFVPPWHHDHVVVEYHDGDRWRRFDPEVEKGDELLPDPLDMEFGDRTPFQTAATVYSLMRSGELDPATYGVAPDTPFSGKRFVVGEVFYELAHRYGDEVLLWDDWGVIHSVDNEPDDEVLTLADEVSALLLAADAGDIDAESRLFQRYLTDVRLNPGGVVTRYSPYGDAPVQVALRN